MNRRTIAFLLSTLALVAAGCIADDFSTNPDSGPHRLVFVGDSVVLAGPGCFTELEVDLLGYNGDRPSSPSVRYTSDSPTTLRLGTLIPRIPLQSWRFTGLVADAPGTARVIATLADGSAQPDTFLVRVLAGKGTLDFTLYPITRIAVGDTTRLEMELRTPCAQKVYPSLRDSAFVRVRTLTPNTLTVVDSLAAYRDFLVIRAVARQPGTAIVVASHRGVTDTVRFTVQ